MHRARILTYHSGNDLDYRQMPDDLETVAAAGYRFVPLVALARALVERGLHELPERVACLAFDDGIDADFVDLDHPHRGFQPSFRTIMRDFARRHPDATVHATSFVIASPLARATIEERAMLGYPWMSDRWWQPALASGYFHIGNHSWDHLSVSLDTVAQRDNRKGTFRCVDCEADADAQIVKSRRLIEMIAPNPATVLFAFPYGEPSDYLVADYLPNAIERHGVLAAFGVGVEPVHASSNRWRLPRLVCGDDWKDAAGLRALLEA
jgi:peptidoglycan/xylan/chitin deacetylase (PgdA/CDA1 family)